MPVFVGLQRLHEAGAFLGDVGSRPGQQSVGLEDAIDAGRATGNLIGIEHHEGHAAITFERMGTGKDTDAFFLLVGEPVIARHPGVVLVDLTETRDPIVKLTDADADPGHEATDRQVGLVAPLADEIDDLVTGIVGNPAAL